MSDYCAKSIILTPSLLEWENYTRGILIIVLLSKYKNGEILKKYKFYGEILLLVCLILFDVAIFSQILGIPIAPVTSITNSLFDALSNNESTHDPAGAVQVGAQSGQGEHAATDNNNHPGAAIVPGDPSGQDAAKTPDAGTGNSAKVPGTGNQAAGADNQTAGSQADNNAPQANTSTETVTPEITYAELSGIPIYSIMNAPEYTFLNQVAGYDDNNYSYTMVTACIPPDGSIWDTPAPVVIPVPNDEPGRTYEVQVYSTLERNTVFVQRGIPSGGQAEVYNLTPGDLCGYQIFAEEYAIQTDEGTEYINPRLVVSESFCIRSYEMRGIRTESLHNVRDLGGWSTLDGRHVRYGLLYRGSAFDGGGERLVSDADTSLFLNRLGIRNELDLRWDTEIMLDGVSSLSESINYLRIPLKLYVDFVSSEENGEQLNQIFDMVNADGPVYFHCAIGCDRTGTVSFLLLGLLGVSESDINKEYELSSFSIYGPRTRDSAETYYKEMIEYIKQNFDGATLQEKIQNYLLQRGVSQEKIEAFKAKMLE